MKVTSDASRKNGGRNRGFTLVELLVVVSIIAVLLAFLLPALNKARQAANAVACASNIRQICMGMIMYANENKGIIPGCVWKNSAAGKSPNAYTTGLCAAGFNNYGPYQTVAGWDKQAGNAGTHGGPIGAGLLLYHGYIKNLPVLYCPAREPNSPYSAQTNLDPSKRNFNPPPGNNFWNPGWKGNLPSGNENWGYWVTGGYLVATSDTNDTPSAGYMNCAYLHKLSRARSGLPMVMDVCVWMGAGWGMQGWRQMNQGKGYNIGGFDGSVTFYLDPKDILERHFCLPGGGSGSAPLYPGERPVTFTSNGPYLQDTRSQAWPHYRDNYLAAPPATPDDIGYTGSGQAPANGIAWILHNWAKWGDGDITHAVVE
jgi:prepilin-type N-terminal cleavage/methylation domain-containing protein